MVTAHSIAVSGLSLGTLYHYRVLSRDAAGNLTTSADGTFTTNAVASGGGAGVGGSVTNGDNGSKCGAGSAFAILVMALMFALHLHAPRRSPRD